MVRLLSLVKNPGMEPVGMIQDPTPHCFIPYVLSSTFVLHLKVNICIYIYSQAALLHHRRSLLIASRHHHKNPGLKRR